MSIQSTRNFLEEVATTQALHTEAIDAWSRAGMPTILRLAERLGHDVSAEDVIYVRDHPAADISDAAKAFGKQLDDAMKLEGGTDLSDEELEVISAGIGLALGPMPGPK